MNGEPRSTVPSLRPHDVVVVLQLALRPQLPYAALAEAVGLSQGESHNAVKRLTAARLLRPGGRQPNRTALLEFLTSGVPYAFAAEPGPIVRGVPTAHSAPPLAAEVLDSDPVVWPSVEGQVRGASVEPLYPGAPATAQRNPDLYELLVLVDALRIGRARERQRAKAILHERLATRQTASD
jgi:DNA-binding Lrp family transcriptional regulator